MKIPKPTRRRFLQAGASLLPALNPALSKAAPATRPNILFAIADDWSWPFASIAGDKTARTPNFDRVAREGVLFRYAYTAAPTCTASRGSILTGQWFARLEQGGNLWSTLPGKFDVYPDLLEHAGYRVGFTGKGWGPGDYEPGGRTRNPAGPEFNKRHAPPPTKGIHNIDYAQNFADFLGERKAGQPFCFWYGGHEPHRPYEAGTGLRAGKNLADVRLPGGLPDSPEVRGDLLDYALEIEWFDNHLGRMLKMLEQAGELDNTIVVVTGDNGLPFPRCKANLYDNGTHVPLAVRWGAKVPGGRTVDDFISLPDVAPTFLEAAGVAVPAAMTARSFLGILTSRKEGRVDPKRERVFTGRERHTIAQPDSKGGYPMRALRTRDYLYIRNYRPERYPAGNDTHSANAFRDIDPGPAKDYMMQHRGDSAVANLFELGFGKRPAEELYDLRTDAAELRNLAADASKSDVKTRLAAELDAQLKAWRDPRAFGRGDEFDNYPYLGSLAEQDFFDKPGSQKK
jgi:uncharacterized sulfatase